MAIFSQKDRTEEIIRRMVAVVSKGGNYLLNVGPTGEGIIPWPSVAILKRVGEWIGQNGESIYGTSPFPNELSCGYCTRKGNLLYLHVFEWPEDIIEWHVKTFRLYPENQLDHYLMYFKSIELVPVNENK